MRAFWHRLFAFVLALSCVGTWELRAFAADDPGKIFSDARQSYKDGEYQQALDGFERVMELSDSPNAVFYAGKALRELGRLDEAYARFEQARNDAAAKAGEQARYAQTRDAADDALRALEPRISKLVITVPASVTDAEVSVDGKVLASSVIGESLPMMPGEHTIEAKAPGYEPITATVQLKAGKTKTMPLFASATTIEPQPPGGGPPDGDEPDDTLLWVGVVVAGAGVAGVAVGAVFGGISLTKKSERDDNCVDLACNAAGIAAAEDGATFGNVSTVGFVVGGVALAVGVTMVVLSLTRTPRDDKETQAVWHPTQPTSVHW